MPTLTIWQPHFTPTSVNTSALGWAFRDFAAQYNVTVNATYKSWGTLYEDVVKAHDDPTLPQPDVIVTGDTWAGDLYSKGVFASLQSYLGVWKTERSRGDITSDIVRD